MSDILPNSSSTPSPQGNGKPSSAPRRIRSRHAAAREPFKKRFLSFLRNLVWVIPLTVLIWIYAEREQWETLSRVPIPITVRASNPNRIVTLINPPDKVVYADLAGPKARLERVRDLVNPLGRESGIVVTVPANFPLDSEQPLNAIGELVNQEIFVRNGITITSCVPSNLIVRVDEMIEIDARVQPPPRFTFQLTGPIVFDPPVVKVRGPKSILSDPSRLNVYADLTELESVRSPGEHKLDNVRLICSTTGGDASSLITIPDIVRATLKIRQSEVTYTIPSMPVFVSGPVNLLDKYRVVFPNGPTLPRVTVIGPEDEIRRLKNEEFVPKAILEISNRDVVQPLPRSLTFSLPPGVIPSDDDKKRTIDFKLVDRSSPE